MTQAKSRNTIQKTKIFEILKSTRTHPTAEWVYEKIKKEIPSISLATVYRNLNQMYEEGKIKRLEINKEFHYDGFNHPHQHLVCVNCGKIIDLEIKNLNKNIMNKVKNFLPFTIEIIIYGLCEKCSKKQRKNLN